MAGSRQGRGLGQLFAQRLGASVHLSHAPTGGAYRGDIPGPIRRFPKFGDKGLGGNAQASRLPRRPCGWVGKERIAENRQFFG